MRDMSPKEEAYRARGVEILAVNTLEDPADGKAFIAGSDLHLRWAFADETVTAALGVKAVPSQIILDREGKVVWTSSLTSLMGGSDAIFDALDAAL